MSASDIWVKVHTTFGKTFSYRMEDLKGEEGLRETIDLTTRTLGRTGKFISVTVEDGTEYVLNKDHITYVEASQEAAE